MKNPTEELTGIFSSLWSWDISLTLNMTYFFLFVIARKCSDEAISREGGFPQGIHYFTLVVGYFAALNMTYFFYLSLRGSVATKQSPGRVVFRKAYTISL